jgi:hypothetical protein
MGPPAQTIEAVIHADALGALGLEDPRMRNQRIEFLDNLTLNEPVLNDRFLRSQYSAPGRPSFRIALP